MDIRVLAGATMLALGVASAASGQERPAFTGAYAGIEAGAHEHHFYLDQTSPAGATGRYYRAWGVGGGAFAGYDARLFERVRVGAEVNVSTGGQGPTARFNGGRFSMKPDWGYRATGRLGYVVNDRLLVYGTAGWGAHRYDIENTAGVTGAHAWNDSFTVGGGVQYQVSPRVGVRLDFRHLDNSTSSLLIGIPVKF